jgi:hypothetical protein
VLDAGTKGTGAEMVPLEKVLKAPARAPARPFVPPRPRPRPAAASAPRQPRRFKVVDVLSGQVLAEDADARATVALLRNARSVVDVHVYVWQPQAARWRLLSIGEQKGMWERRGA